MSTRANVIIQDEYAKLYFYRHSDGYPDCAGADLKSFVVGYQSGLMRRDAMQSAGWLILRGHYEYQKTPRRDPDPADRCYGWKVGAYEPTQKLYAHVDYIYVIDLKKRELRCLEPKEGFWDKPTLKNTRPSLKFKTVQFGGA